jgi:hypothetical protein
VLERIQDGALSLSHDAGRNSSPPAQSKESPGFLSARAMMTPKNALSRVVASRASEFDFVVAFRADVLDKRLVPFADLPRWIKQRVCEEQPDWLRWLTKERKRKSLASSAESLPWFSPGSQWVERVPVTPGGVLDCARTVAMRLAKEVLWSHPQAVVFLLCGEIPVIFASKVTTIVGTFPALTRVTMDVHLSLSSSEIGALYKRIQRVLMKERTRHRNLTPKHLTLAAFAAEHKSGRTYAELKRLWNKKHPRWKYLGSDEHFGRDCKRAQDKLLMKGVAQSGSLNLTRLS